MGSVDLAPTMRSARIHGNHNIKIDTIPRPKPGPGQIAIDVEWCGICGSDMHAYVAAEATTVSKLPLSIGHEICGRVRDPPEGSKFKDGDAVFVDPRVLCRNCVACKSNRGHVCRTFGYVGGTTPFGGYSESIVADEDMVYALPPEIPLEYAAVIEPLSIVWHAIKVAAVPDWTNQSVLVLGGGPIGFALLLCLRAVGVKQVIVSEPTETRRKQIAEFSDKVLNPITDDVEAGCKSATSGEGVDVVFDCAGVQVALNAGLKAIKYEGLYVMIAVWEKPMVIPDWEWMFKHLTLKGTFVIGDGEVKEVIEMIANGKLRNWDKMVTARIGLDEVVEKGFEELLHHKDDHIKIMVTPRRELLVSS